MCWMQKEQETIYLPADAGLPDPFAWIVLFRGLNVDLFYLSAVVHSFSFEKIQLLKT